MTYTCEKHQDVFRVIPQGGGLASLLYDIRFFPNIYFFFTRTCVLETIISWTHVSD
jgi:hypothetical protein